MKTDTETRMTELGERLRRLQMAVSKHNDEKHRLERQAWLANNRARRQESTLAEKEAEISGYRALLQIQEAYIAVLMEMYDATRPEEERGRIRLPSRAVAALLGKATHTAWKDPETGEIVIELINQGGGEEKSTGEPAGED